MKRMRRIAVMTSGGDAPGMNAAIRAVVRAASTYDLETYGVVGGFTGLLGGSFRPLDDRAVGGVLLRGGTFLGSSRCPGFKDRATQGTALARLAEAEIDGIVVIGGNGSQRGTLALHQLGFPAVGVASTIDNDLAVTETTIGVDTALNTAAEYIDRLKDTATSHHRAFVVETMGRASGYLALMVAIATGAELAVIPEQPVELEAIADDLQASYARGKSHYIAIVAEGAAIKAAQISEWLCQHPCGFEARMTILGHVQRGGSPTVRDRILGSRLGAAAVQMLWEGRSGVMTGWVRGEVVEIPLAAALEPVTKVTPELLALARTLAR